MRTLRIKEKIVEYLEENGPQPTNKILEHLNEVLRWGSTSQQLGNVLSKGKAFDKVGTTQRQGICGGRYEIVVWGLKED